MPDKLRLEFGYNPPPGDRGREQISPREYLSDLHRALDVASQGFSSLWVSDHLNYGKEFRIECWTLLAWIAARYPGPKLGTIVMSNTFRRPAVMAKMAASLQELSYGRFILGYGAGWHEGEHQAFGIGLPRPRVRVDMLEEAVQLIRAMWTHAPASFTGKYYSVDEVYCEPRPNPAPPIMIGGAGEKRTLRVVARHADWWNDISRPLDQLRHKLDVLRQHCEAEGRDFGGIRKTLSIQVFIDRSHSAAVRMAGDSQESAIVGDPAAVREQFSELGEMGFDLFITFFPRFQELDDMKLFMEEVVPAFA